ncbi:MAG TPA: hypothetical protein VMQ81_12985, partial [Acidimicrobiia bacterium]|nr:hypothetical protein [Acidimicrobiia bacterium]
MREGEVEARVDHVDRRLGRARHPQRLAPRPLEDALDREAQRVGARQQPLERPAPGGLLPRVELTRAVGG